MSFMRRLIAVLAIVSLFSLALSVGFRARASDPFVDQVFDNTPKDYIVNSTGDAPDANLDGICETANAGECTFRAAIQEQNATQKDTITFNIPGDGVKTIVLDTGLPEITKTVLINGYTQPGSIENTAIAPAALNSVIKIEVDASQLAQNVSGIIFADGSAGSVIRGLAIYGADSTDQAHANLVLGQSQVLVYGCYVGVKASGQEVSSRARSAGVMTNVDATNANIFIGGSRADQRNLLVGKSDSPEVPLGGILVGPNGKKANVYGNIIGLARDGMTDLGGAYGVVLYGESTTLGSPGVLQNTISGNAYAQVWTKSNNVILSNIIGPDVNNQVQSGISNGVGVKVYGSGNVIGNTSTNYGNSLKGLSGAGVVIAAKRTDGQLYDEAEGNAVVGNIISEISPASLAQGSPATNLPLDIITEDHVGNQTTLALVGQNPQDAKPSFGMSLLGPLNAPVIKSATQKGSQVTLNYNLNVPAESNNIKLRYRVEFYLTTSSNIANAGPAEQYLDAITADAGQDQTTTLTLAPGVNTAYRAITASVTLLGAGPYGVGSTSEFASNQIVGSFVDTDGDAISDAEEDAGPNNGDANGDGTPDKLQATVTTFVSQASQQGLYMTFINSGCANNARADDIDARGLNKPDTAYGYPYGLVDFALRCTQGATARVTMYVYVDDDPSKYSLRKYNYESQLFSTLAGASITKSTINGQNVLKAEYDIADGGALDEDGEANGVILDPIGLAIAGYQYNLPQVGVALIYILTPLALALLTILTYVYFDYLRHKRPLVEENPHIHYTFWHHLNVVTFPILKYKISFVIERQDTR